MKKEELSLDIKAIVQSLGEHHPNEMDLNLAFQSLAKRSRFGQIYLHELDKCLQDHKLPLERAGIEFTEAGYLFSNRTYYEAYIFAFMQNIHAALDSLPFIVFMMLGTMSYTKAGKAVSITSRTCSWSTIPSAVKATFPAEKKIGQLLTNFASNKNFLILQAMVNKSKHQSLIRILNDGENVAFEEVEYYVKGKKIKGTNIHARNFMRDSSNELFPALFEIVEALRTTRIRLSK